ncbi:MAG: GNAT family N-acetyltransferase [Gemmatimonadetes bacterium]|nr:GNAT family N-acetyltransferase [Gemmatimonadota bacterium]
MIIRAFAKRDLAAALRLWNDSVQRGEVLLKRMAERDFQRILEGNPSYDGSFDFVAEEEGKIAGYISGITKKVFLPKETAENTPGYLTAIFVDADHRRRGIGTALLQALLDAFRRDGKRDAVCFSSNPIDLGWTIPDTPGHDHNNMPGVDIECAGYPFLHENGFADVAVEVAMYLNLSDYRETPIVEELQEKLLGEGIRTGRYDVGLGYDFDRMCDHVGSEYWRSVLREETQKRDPRPILAATHEGHIVGFTGPVDREDSGRGWFTGICTDPDFEKRGIATVLFNLLMREFIRKGALFSTLFTGDTSHAQRLYLRTGFEIKRRFALMKKPLIEE